MGCSQTKANAPAEPQKAEETPTLLVDANQNATKWSLQDEVDRVFELADKDSNGQLDTAELTNVRNSKDFAEAMMDMVDTDLSGTVSKDEWSGYFKKLFGKNEKSAVKVLELYEKQIGENKTMKLNDDKDIASPDTTNWALRSEVVRVFDLADKDHNGQLDMNELSNVRNSREFAEAMMDKVDTDLSGTVSQSEWLVYFQSLFEKNENSASLVLKLYEKQIEENKNIKLNATPASAEPAEPEPELPVLEEKVAPSGGCLCQRQ